MWQSLSGNPFIRNRQEVATRRKTGRFGAEILAIENRVIGQSNGFLTHNF